MINHFPYMAQPSVDSGESMVSGSFIFNQLPLKVKAQLKNKQMSMQPSEHAYQNFDIHYDGCSVDSGWQPPDSSTQMFLDSYNISKCKNSPKANKSNSVPGMTPFSNETMGSNSRAHYNSNVGSRQKIVNKSTLNYNVSQNSKRTLSNDFYVEQENNSRAINNNEQSVSQQISIRKKINDQNYASSKQTAQAGRIKNKSNLNFFEDEPRLNTLSPIPRRLGAILPHQDLDNFSGMYDQMPALNSISQQDTQVNLADKSDISSNFNASQGSSNMQNVQKRKS